MAFGLGLVKGYSYLASCLGCESVVDELKRRVVYHTKESQVHRQLLDITINLPEGQERRRGTSTGRKGSSG